MEFKAVTVAKEALTSRKKRRSKRSEAKQRRLVALWQSSGEKQTTFCRRHDLNPKTCSRWVKAFNGRPQKTNAIQVESMPSQTQTCLLHGIDIYSPNGVRFHLHDGIPFSQLSQIPQGDYECNLN